MSFWGWRKYVRSSECPTPSVLKMAFHRQKGRLDIPYVRHWSSQMLEQPAVRELDDLIATSHADRPA